MIKKHKMNYSGKVLYMLECVAQKKAGAGCFGFLYEPKVPEGLRKTTGMHNGKELDKSC